MAAPRYGGPSPIANTAQPVIIQNPVICIPNPKFYQVKVENYGINVTPDKISSRKSNTRLMLR